jgi:hypothetical protein
VLCELQVLALPRLLGSRHIYIGQGMGFGSVAFWRRGDLPVFLFRIRVGYKVHSSRIQANSPRAPARMYRAATPIMPNGHMRSCPGRAARQVSVLATPRDRDPGTPTGAPKKVRGRPAQAALEEGRRVDRQSPGAPGTLLNQCCVDYIKQRNTHGSDGSRRRMR